MSLRIVTMCLGRKRLTARALCGGESLPSRTIWHASRRGRRQLTLALRSATPKSAVAGNRNDWKLRFSADECIVRTSLASGPRPGASMSSAR